MDFPYLVLLVSGGHSLLAIVEDVDKFYLLGTTIDNAPGEVLDKVHLQIITYIDNISFIRDNNCSLLADSNLQIYQSSHI